MTSIADASGIIRFGPAYWSSPFQALSDIAIGFFALWTLVWNACYFLGGSLALAAYLFPIVLGLSFLIPLLHGSSSGEFPKAASASLHDSWYFALFAIIWAFLSMVINRPDPDEETYIGLMVSYLANPFAPINTLPDFQFGVPTARYAISSLDPLRAVISYITGHRLLSIYYIWVPAVGAGIAAIISLRFFRLFKDDQWIVAMIFLTAIMFIWGDVHRTYANFGLARIFQGKGLLVTLFVPALFLYFFKLVDGGHSRYYLLMLFFALFGAVGANPTGLGVGAFLLLLLAVAAVQPGDIRKHGVAVAFIAAAVLPVALFMVFQYGANPSKLVHTADGFVSRTTNLEVYQLVFGDSPRGALMLLLSVISIWFVPPGRIRAIYRKFLFIFLVLLALPWMSDMLAKLTYPTFAWRWLWIAPVSLFASIGIAGLFGMVRDRSNRIYAVVVLAVSIVSFIQMHPRTVISESNGASVSWPGYKIDPARGRKEGRPDNQIFLRNRREWAVIDDGWLLVESVGQRF